MGSKHGFVNFIPIYFCIWTFTIVATGYPDENLNLGSNPTVVGPIDPAILDYLADHLHPSECAQLCTFLALHNRKTLPNANSKNLRGWGVSGNDQRRPPNTFACHRTLKLWNDNIATIEAENKLDGTEYVENIMQYALKQIHRPDLANWMVNLAEQRLKSGIRFLEEEEEIHMQHGLSTNDSVTDTPFRSNDSNSTTGESLLDDDDDEIDIQRDLPPEIYMIIVFASLGAMIVAILSITIWCCSRIQPKQVLHKDITSGPRKSSLQEKAKVKDEEDVRLVYV